MKKEKECQKKDFRTLTFRLSEDLYQKCVNKTIEQSVQRGKIIKISEREIRNIHNSTIKKLINDL
jgi:hypothetical protein